MTPQNEPTLKESIPPSKISPEKIQRRVKASPLCNFLKELHAPKSTQAN